LYFFLPLGTLNVHKGNIRGSDVEMTVRGEETRNEDETVKLQNKFHAEGGNEERGE
jgi:hypothetical protein